METSRIKEMVVKKDGQDTWEIRNGTFVKGGIFLHDLPKFINDVLKQALTETYQAGVQDAIAIVKKNGAHLGYKNNVLETLSSLIKEDTN